MMGFLSYSVLFDDWPNVTEQEDHDPSDRVTIILPLSKESLQDRLSESAACRRKYRLWNETGGRCIYCGCGMEAEDFVTGNGSDIEHIVPKTLGGGSTLDNIVCACRDCNREKGDKMPLDFMMEKDPFDLKEYLEHLRHLYSIGAITEEKYLNLLRTQKQ